MNSIKKRPRDSYDQTDLQSHTVRLNERIIKYHLHNYGSAMDIFDAIARTLLPYWEYNERYKIKIFQQLLIDPPSITNMAHHVRAQLQILHNEQTHANPIIIRAMDITNGVKSIYLENSPHGRTLQILSNVLGIEIRLVTSYIYEEIISVIPDDLLEIQPLYIAYNDVSKQFFMLDQPANVKRDDLLQHQQNLDQFIQKYNLLPTLNSSGNFRSLPLFLSIAQIFRSTTTSTDILDTSGLANQIRDAVYQQIKSNYDQYEKYLSSDYRQVDIRRDSQSLIELNYYRYQLERPILFALAHVLQCNLVIFSSTTSIDQQPDVIVVDRNREEQLIVLLKNESIQRFTSARTSYPFNHLIFAKQTENSSDPIYETIDHSPLVDLKPTKSSPPSSASSNTFFSKTKDKFVTAVNKLVDNYGNVPKKQTYTLNTFSRSTEQTVPNSSSPEQKAPGIKRQAPLAEHVLRQQEQTHRPTTSEITYENTNPTSATHRSVQSTATKNSQPSSSASNKRQLRPVPYKDRQKTLTRMSTPKTSVHQNIFNGVVVEDVEDSTTADEGNNNNDDEYDSFSDEAADEIHSVILKERKKKTTTMTTKLPREQLPPPTSSAQKSSPYHYDHESLRRQQQQSSFTPDEDFYENDRLTRDELSRDDDDIYLSTSDILKQDRKQLQLFVNDRTNTTVNNNKIQQERKIFTPKPTSISNDRQSFLIDKDAVLEVLGHNIAQRDRHILMKVLKQEDLISKEWQRLVYLLDEYVNNPKREKKERGLYALTLMENLDRLGYDMLEIQSQGPNHFKAIGKSILLIIEINDWFSEHICRVLHLNGPNDTRMVRHLRKLCVREWSKYPDNYRTLFAQLNATQSQRTTLDLTREIERFRSDDYYRADMCILVNQALATALATPIHVVRAVREPNNALEIYVPMRGIARPGLAIVLIASHPNTGDGRYDVAVLKGHPQTLRKHRNVTFDDKPEVRSFETNADEQKQQQQQPTTKVTPPTNNPTIPQQAQIMNPNLMAAHSAQFFGNPFLYTPFTFATPQQQQQQQPQQPQAPNSPSPVRPTNTNTTTNTNNPSKPTLAGTTNSTVPATTMILQPQMPFIQMQQTQPTFVYNPLMHTAQQPAATNATATFFYTPANYPM